MNKPKEYYPEFYHKFNCIASECPDTCCKEWDIVVDDEAFVFYSSISDEFGNSIISNTMIDQDGDRIFVLKNGKCPLLTGEKLCEIQLRYGEQHLCSTCREFPRISQDYTEFVEHMLSIACPEACRMVLSGECVFEDYSISKIQNDDNGYEKDFMNFLIKARAITAGLFTNNNKTFQEQLTDCIYYSDYIQRLIDINEFNLKKLYEYNIPINIDTFSSSRRFVFDVHKDMDIMDKKWLDEMYLSADSVLVNTHQTDSEYRNLALYYIYRYFLNAIDSYDIISVIKRIYCAYIVCSAMTDHAKAENDTQKRTLIIERYSKEIEHSYENINKLLEEFATNKNFSLRNIINSL